MVPSPSSYSCSYFSTFPVIVAAGCHGKPGKKVVESPGLRPIAGSGIAIDSELAA
jgi:hypothetical protein